MDTPDTPHKPARRRYSDVEQGEALAALTANGGNVLRTAAVTGIPETTLRQWARGVCRPLPAELREQKKSELAERFEAMAFAAVEVVADKLEQLQPYQAALVAGICTDKALLLRGEATSIHETRDDARLEEFHRLYGRLRAARPLAPTHEQDGAPVAPTPHDAQPGPDDAPPADDPITHHA